MIEELKCYSCPYAKWPSLDVSTEPKLECDPPMGECLLDRPQSEKILGVKRCQR